MTRASRLGVATLVPVLALAALVYRFEARQLDNGVPTPTLPAGASPRLPDDRPVPPGLEKATLASGCFWCTESDFDAVAGVIRTTSGYTGGDVAHPTYIQVSAGGTGHVEAVEIVFDPERVTFGQLIDHYWRHVDAFNDRGQFCDYGEQYRPVIFVHSPTQRELATLSKARLQARFKEQVRVDIVDASAFFPAEEAHQDYHVRNPLRYRYYRWSCGRDARLAQIWAPSS